MIDFPIIRLPYNVNYYSLWYQTTLKNYGRRHFKIFTNCHVSWDTLYYHKKCQKKVLKEKFNVVRGRGVGRENVIWQLFQSMINEYTNGNLLVMSNNFKNWKVLFSVNNTLILAPFLIVINIMYKYVYNLAI